MMKKVCLLLSLGFVYAPVCAMKAEDRDPALSGQGFFGNKIVSQLIVSQLEEALDKLAAIKKAHEESGNKYEFGNGRYALDDETKKKLGIDSLIDWEISLKVETLD